MRNTNLDRRWREGIHLVFRIGVVLLTGSLLDSCGGGSSITVPPIRQLISVAVQPSNATAVQGRTFLFTATGTFDQAPMQTNLPAQWASSDTNVATIDTSTGVATCVGVGGPITVTASDPGKGGTIQGSASLTCNIPSGTAIQMDPATLKFVCVPVGLGVCGCTGQKTTTLSNVTNGALAINSITINSPGNEQHFFLDSTTCSSNVGAGQSCTITVHWARNIAADGATLEISDSGDVDPQLVSLTGQSTCSH